MPSVSMRQLLEAGVHFGHQTRRWNPKMKPYIFAERNGIHIIDLAQTVKRLDAALDFVTETVARGDSVLFVGTKKQAQEPIAAGGDPRRDAVRQPALAGRHAHQLRDDPEAHRPARPARGPPATATSSACPRRRPRAHRGDEQAPATLGGIRKMRRLPGAIFVVDPQREHIAVTEARKLEIPVIGTGDTNVDPDLLDYVIPANDDAIRAIRLLCRLVADAAIEGAGQRAARASSEAEDRRPPSPSRSPS